MDGEKRRVGRPRTRPEEKGPGDYVGFRAPRDLKEKLERAAQIAGRSLSTETQFRLEQSFERQLAVSQALDFRFGPRTAAVIQLIAKLLEHAGDEALVLSGSQGTDWLSDPYVFDQVERGLGRLFAALRPRGDTALKYEDHREDWQGVDLTPIAARIGERVSATVLDAVIDPPQSRLGLREWAHSVA